MESKSNRKMKVVTLSDSRRRRLLESLQKTIWWSGSLSIERKKA